MQQFESAGADGDGAGAADLGEAGALGDGSSAALASVAPPAAVRAPDVLLPEPGLGALSQ
jgi:hypothetical protein